MPYPNSNMQFAGELLASQPSQIGELQENMRDTVSKNKSVSVSVSEEWPLRWTSGLCVLTCAHAYTCTNIHKKPNQTNKRGNV